MLLIETLLFKMAFGVSSADGFSTWTSVLQLVHLQKEPSCIPNEALFIAHACVTVNPGISDV